MNVRLMAVAAALCAAGSYGDVIIGNYPPTNDSTQSADIDNLRQKALAFTMPAGSAYGVTSVTLRLQNYLSSDNLILEIRDHTGSNTVPGAVVIGAFTAPGSNSSAIGDFVFSPIGSVSLQPSTSYWLTLRGADSATSVDWKGSSPAKTPTGIATHLANLFTSNGGTSWSGSSIMNTYQIDGVVPSPATAAVVLMGMAALRRRR